MEKPKAEQRESAEKGKNVEILFLLMRHGEKSGNELTDLGRQITAQKARESNFKVGDFDMVKAYGSDAKPPPDGLPRAFETADIYASAITESDENKKGVTRKRSVLSFVPLKNPDSFSSAKGSFSWDDYYKSQLPENFDTLSDEEKKECAKKAASAAMQQLFDLADPEKSSDEELRAKAEGYIVESAGSAAYQILHLTKMTGKLNNGSRVLIPGGTHGVVPESLMREALVQKMEDGTEMRGYKTLEEFGGEFDPSEAFSVRIRTDEEGNLQRLNISFEDEGKRPKADEMYLDMEKIKELADYYAELHQDNLKDRGVIIR